MFKKIKDALLEDEEDKERKKRAKKNGVSVWSS